MRGGLVLAGALLIAMFVSLDSARAAGACADADVVPTPRNGGQLADAVLCLVNQERVERGLRGLAEEPRLLKAARRHSTDMVRRRYFDHRSPEGESMADRAKAARYATKARAWRVAENLAWGSGSYGSPRHVVSNWMKSSMHRRNILDGSLRHAGVGVAGGSPQGRGGATFTLVLGRR